jgi:hypothetical protein
LFGHGEGVLYSLQVAAEKKKVWLGAVEVDINQGCWGRLCYMEVPRGRARTKKKTRKGLGASLGFAAPPFFCFMFLFLGFLVMASPLVFFGIVPL